MRAWAWIAIAALAFPLSARAQSGTDYDGDSVVNAIDNCPFAANLDQADGGGVGSSLPDGVGDACQCGDLNASARVDLIDVVIFRRDLAALGPGIGDPALCSVAGSALDCDAADVAALRASLAGISPGVAQVCGAAVAFSGNAPVPQALNAVGGNTVAALDWQALASPLLGGYHVYRATSVGGPYTRITPTPLSAASFLDTGLSNGTPYSYVVTSVAVDATESAFSNEATLSPQTTGPTTVGGTITANTTWTLAGSPYLVTSALTLNTGTLTIQAGVEIRVSAGLTFTVNSGRLRALGTEAARIRFTSSAQPAVAGSWRSLDFNASAQPSELRHVRIEGGGGSGTVSLILGSPSLTAENVSVGLRGSTGISVSGSNIALTGCVVEPANAVGVSINGGSPTLDGCTISGSATQRGIAAIGTTTNLRILNSTVSHGLELPFADAGLVVSGNTFVNYPVGPGFRLYPNHVSPVLNANTVEGLVPSTSVVTVLGGTLGVTSSWPGLVYNLESSLTASLGAGGSWTLLAGARVRVPPSSTVTIDTGALRALGTAVERVFFTSVAQPAVAGSWRSLDFNPSAQPSELRHVRIEGGGGSGTVSLILGSPSLTAENVSVGLRGSTGISVSGSNIALTGCVVEPANAVGVSIGGGSPTLDGCTISGSATQRGIAAIGTTTNLRILNSTVSHGLELPFADAGLVVSGNTFVNYPVGPGFRLYPNHVSPVLNANTVEGLVPSTSVVTVLGGTLGVTSSWPGLVYNLESSLTASLGAGGSWTLLAGARVRVPPSSTVTINTGALRALGTAVERVFFTSVAQPAVTGSWRSLDFNASAQPSELRHVRIEGGGSSGTVSLILGSPSLTAENVSVGLRGSTGISVSGSNVALTGCVVEPANAVGVSIGGGSPTLDGCTISGSATQRGIAAIGTTTNLRILNSTVSHGLELPFADAGLVVSGNTFVNYPVGPGFRLYPNHVSPVLNANTVEGLVPSTSVVTVLGGTLGVTSSWPGLVYNLESSLTASLGAGGSWTLLAGARVRVPPSSTVTINTGALRALGTAVERVFFTSVAQPAVTGSWRSLDFNASAQPSELRHVRIEGGGSSGTVSLILGSPSLTAENVSVGLRGSTGISVSGSNVALTGCVVEPANAVGVSIGGGSPTLDGCTISGSATQRGIVAIGTTTNLRILNSTVSHGLELPFADAGLVVSGNTFVNYPVGPGFRLFPNHVSPVLNANTVAGFVPSTSVVSVLGGTLGVTSSWPGLVYTLESGLTASLGAGGTWTLLAGARVRVPPGASVTINTGALRALGTAVERVFFTSVAQPAVTGSWRSLDFNASAQPSELRHVRIEGGGGSGTVSLILGSPSVTAENVSVGLRGATGISLASTNAVLTGCVVEAANAIGVSISGGSATLDGCTIAASATQRGVSVAGGATTDVRILNSTVTHGVAVAGSDLEMRDSIVSQSGANGLECTGTTGRVRATGNTFTSNASAGISCGARIVQIERNTISGSAVGIRISGVDPRLRIRNNNVSGNTLALQNQVTAGVDARLNWWGTASNPAALASGPALTNPWLAGAFSGPAAVLDAAALPLDFAPQTNSTTFSANFSETGTWSLAVFDSTATLVRSFAGAGAQLAQSWAGDDGSGSPLPGDTYAYTLDVQTPSGNAAPIRGELGLDPGLLSARIDSPQNLQYLVGSSIPVQGVASGAGLSSYVLSFAPGGAPADSAFATIATATTPVSGSIANWNAAGQTQGVYTLRLQANGPGASTARAEALVRLVSATGTSATQYFSPNADGVLDLSNLTSQLTVDTPWTVRVRDAASQVVRELSGDLAEVAATWNGRDGGDVPQPEGVYSLQIVATAIAAQPVLASASTTLDVTAPAAVIDLPTEGTPVLSYDGVPITGTAQDLHLDEYRLAAAPPGSPTAFATFATVGTPVVAGPLGTLSVGSATAPAYTNGTVGLRLSVDDLAGNSATANRTVAIDQLRITNVSATPASIDPLLGQTSTLAYTLNHPSDVSIRLYRSGSGGALAHTLLQDAPHASGPNSDIWDGRGASGDPLPATAYYFSIGAADSEGRVALYNEPTAPLLGTTEAWSNVRFNGATTLGAAVFEPFRNDELRIDYTMSGDGLHSIEVRSVPCCASFRIPLRTLTPVAEGPTTLRWDGRLPSGAVLAEDFGVFFDFPRPIEANAIFVTYEFPFGDVRTNPYVFHPTLAEVTNLKYQLPRPAEVTVDVIDPNGNFLVTVQPTTLQPAGDYEVRWDGLDGDGLIVTTEGSYTLDLRARDVASNQVFVRRATTMVAR